MSQLEFDLPRCTRQHWLRRMIIPSFQRTVDGVTRITHGDAVAPFLISAEFVTYGRNDHVTCLAEIAKQMTVHSKRKKTPSITTARRAMHDCIELRLLTVTPSKGRGIQIAIDFCRVKEILLGNPATAGVILVPNRQPGTPSNSPGTPSNSQSTPSNVEGVLDGVPFQTGTPDLPSWEVCPSTLEGVPDARTSSSPARFNQTQNQGELNNLTQACMIDPEESEDEEGFEKEEKRFGESLGSIISNSSKPAAYSWPIPITAAALTLCVSIDQLFRHAHAEGWVTESERIHFFATANWLVRQERLRKRSNYAILNIGGYFTDLVKRCEWKGSREDREYAIANIKRAIAFFEKAKSRT